MVFTCVRRIGRLFAVLLLLWTTVDLVEHFSPDGSLPMAGTQGASVGQLTTAVAARQAPHADHSFCCSHSVDVKTPFAVAVADRLIGLASQAPPARPVCNPAGLYHPPLA